MKEKYQGKCHRNISATKVTASLHKHSSWEL